jgi:anti-anti-sigma factor
MATTNFQHLRLSMVGDVAVVEIRTRDLHGPKAARELGSELSEVVAQDWAQRLVVDFRRTGHLSSSGFAALFRLVNRARESGRQVRFCNLMPAVLIGAEVIGLPKVVEIHDTQAAAVKAFAPA